MKVCQEIDVDGITITINADKKLEAKVPANAGSVEIEEVTNVVGFGDSTGSEVASPFYLVKDDNQPYPVTKIGRLKGTDWLVFQVDGLPSSNGGSNTGENTGGNTGTTISGIQVTYRGGSVEVGSRTGELRTIGDYYVIINPTPEQSALLAGSTVTATLRIGDVEIATFTLSSAETAESPLMLSFYSYQLRSKVGTVVGKNPLTITVTSDNSNITFDPASYSFETLEVADIAED